MHEWKCLSVDTPPASCPLCQGFCRKMSWCDVTNGSAVRALTDRHTHAHTRDLLHTLDHWRGRESDDWGETFSLWSMSPKWGLLRYQNRDCQMRNWDLLNKDKRRYVFYETLGYDLCKKNMTFWCPLLEPKKSLAHGLILSFKWLHSWFASTSNYHQRSDLKSYSFYF